MISSSSTTVQSGSNLQLTAVAYDVYMNTVASPTITWSVSPTPFPGSATIDATGLLTGGIDGPVVVVATDSGGVKQQISITVTGHNTLTSIVISGG